MKTPVSRRARRIKGVSFKPNRDYLNQAIEDYLAKGGKITRLELDEKAYQEFISVPEAPSAVDEFLSGN